MALNWKGMTEEIIVNSGINILTGLAFAAVTTLPMFAYFKYAEWKADRDFDKTKKQFEKRRIEIDEMTKSKEVVES